MHIGLEGSGSIAVEEDDLRGINTLMAHFQPGIKESRMPGDEDLGVGNVQVNEIYTCLLQHVGMLTVHPSIRVAVVAEVRLCPVGLSAVLINVLDSLLGTQLQVQLGIILHVDTRAYPAEEVEQTHIAIRLGIACGRVIRHGTAEIVGGCPGRVINDAELVGLGNDPFFLHVGEDHVVQIAVNITQVHGEVTRGV